MEALQRVVFGASEDASPSPGEVLRAVSLEASGMCLGQVPFETLSWPSCLFEALTFDWRNLSPGREVSEVSCQPTSTWSQSRQVVTTEIHVDRKERVFQFSKGTPTENFSEEHSFRDSVLSCGALRRWLHAPVYVPRRHSLCG